MKQQTEQTASSPSLYPRGMTCKGGWCERSANIRRVVNVQTCGLHRRSMNAPTDYFINIFICNRNSTYTIHRARLSLVKRAVSGS